MSDMEFHDPDPSVGPYEHIIPLCVCCFMFQQVHFFGCISTLPFPPLPPDSLLLLHSMISLDKCNLFPEYMSQIICAWPNHLNVTFFFHTELPIVKIEISHQFYNPWPCI